MTDSNWDILSGFLRSPLERNCFNAFFEFTYRRTLAYLRYLHRQGFRLPIDDRTDSDPLADLVTDVLGEIVAPKGNVLFPELFKFLGGHCSFGFPDKERGKIEALYSAFLTVQIRQRLSRLRGERNPQIENLKRRIKDILKEPPFMVFPSSTGSGMMVCHIEDQNNHERSSFIPIDELKNLVEQAFLKTTTRSTWCTEIFRHLNKTTKYKPCIQLSDLIATMVEVNIRYIENNSIPSAPLSGTHAEIIKKRAKSAKQIAVDTIQLETVKRFVETGRITREEAGYFQKALDQYLEDFSTSGNTDQVPTYFRESMPPETHSRYLSDYKYVFETVLNSGREHFLMILRQDPIFRSLSNYFLMESDKKGHECTSDE
jgi:hypothetical protein